MTDRRRRRAAPSDDAPREDNPFAAPPEGRPDQPWQPRHQAGSHGGPGTGGQGHGGQEDADGSGGSGGPGSGSGEEGSGDGRDSGSDRERPWGSHWSSRQPGRQSGGFGGGSGGQEDGDGNGKGGGLARGMRWDPTDPSQRHARYSLHTGVWALFFSLFSLPEVALLLGALSVYWGISALRSGKSSSAAGASGKRGQGAAATAQDVAGTDRPEPAQPSQPSKPGPQVPVAVSPAQAAKSRTTAAVSGLITASLALTVVAATFTFQQVYSEYFTCTEDALTQSSREDCKELLPTELRPLLEERSASSAGGLQMR